MLLVMFHAAGDDEDGLDVAFGRKVTPPYLHT